MGEYRQVFKNSNIILTWVIQKDTKKTNSKKIGGDKSHLFSEFTHIFETKENTNSSLTIKTQDVSNDKYLKLYKIDSNLVDYNQKYLENSISYFRTELMIIFLV